MEFHENEFASTPYYVCYDQKGALNTGEIREIGCQTLGIGKYVIIDKNAARLDPLIICEAEVYGRRPTPDDSEFSFVFQKIRSFKQWLENPDIANPDLTNLSI